MMSVASIALRDKTTFMVVIARRCMARYPSSALGGIFANSVLLRSRQKRPISTVLSLDGLVGFARKCAVVHRVWREWA